MLFRILSTGGIVLKKQSRIFISAILGMLLLAGNVYAEAAPLESIQQEASVYYADAISGDYQYSVNKGVATITKYTGSAATLTIPGKLGGYTVTGIGNYAFKGNKTLTEITIPKNVKKNGY